MSQTIAKSRFDLHQRLAQGFIDAYALAPERGRVVYPEEWVHAPDCKVLLNNFGLTMFSGGFLEVEIGALIAAAALSISDCANAEVGMWHEVLPDFRGVSAQTWLNDEGFLVRARYEGTAADGTVYGVDELDFVWTNEAGEIVRWENWLDNDEWDAMMRFKFGKPSSELSFFDYWAAWKWPQQG